MLIHILIGVKTANKGRIRTVLTGNNLAISIDTCPMSLELIQLLGIIIIIVIIIIIITIITTTIIVVIIVILL